MAEYEDRVEVLKSGRFIGLYRRGPFEINYSRKKFTAGGESYILHNTALRLIEAVIRCYPDIAPWERLEFFVFGDSEVSLPRRNLHVHVTRIRKAMISSKYEISTVWGVGLMIKEREHDQSCCHKPSVRGFRSTSVRTGRS